MPVRSAHTDACEGLYPYDSPGEPSPRPSEKGEEGTPRSGSEQASPKNRSMKAIGMFWVHLEPAQAVGGRATLSNREDTCQITAEVATTAYASLLHRLRFKTSRKPPDKESDCLTKESAAHLCS